MVVRAASATSEVPDMNKRNIMNLVLLGGISLPVGSLALPYALFFVPKRWRPTTAAGAAALTIQRCTAHLQLQSLPSPLEDQPSGAGGGRAAEVSC